MEKSKINNSLSQKESAQFKLNNQFSLHNFRIIFLKPFLTGILTFLVFLSVTILVDYIVNISSENYKIRIDTFAIFIASAGFILGFAYRLLTISRKK